jgi:rod shape-determining protein MreC
VLIFNFNNYQKVKYLNSANQVTASIYNSFNSVVNYFALVKINRELAHENATLKTILQTVPRIEIIPDPIFSEGVETDSSFRFISARVINNSVNRTSNYITLNKGKKHGIKPDQGIISREGIVGVITRVSDSYSIGLSVLNQRWSISTKLKKNDFLGSLAWGANEYRFANLLEIPFHVELAFGDTVLTSGYSSIFPEGIMIGTIQSFLQPEGGNYYDIKVKLSTNFKALTFVDVIDNLNKAEIKKLEHLIQDDPNNN